MFTQARKFSLIIAPESKLSIHTEPVGGALKVSVWFSKPNEEKNRVISGTVFKVNRNFSHNAILDAPYTHFEAGGASDLDLASYRVFKNEILTAMRAHLMKLQQSTYDRSSEANRIDACIRIISRGMRHPDEVKARSGLLRLVK